MFKEQRTIPCLNLMLLCVIRKKELKICCGISDDNSNS
jgi:hypothetical protein